MSPAASIAVMKIEPLFDESGPAFDLGEDGPRVSGTGVPDISILRVPFGSALRSGFASARC